MIGTKDRARIGGVGIVEAWTVPWSPRWRRGRVGPEAVHGICMPSRYSSSGSLDDARDLAARFGMMHLHEIGIEPIHEALRQSLQPALGEGWSTDENLQARARGVLVMGLANAQGFSLATYNKRNWRWATPRSMATCAVRCCLWGCVQIQVL